MAERGISRDEVLSTLDHPLRTVNAENSRFEAQGWIERSQKRMLLRVICENGAIVTVVTAMATSKFEKIWSGPMKIEYDPKADAMYIRLIAGTVVESDEVRPGVVFDLDAAGRVLGIEMLDVSQRTDNPRELAMELVGV